MAVATEVRPDTVTTFSVGPDPIENYLCLRGGDIDSGPLIKCRPGWMTLLSPSGHHERTNCRLKVLVAAVCSVLRIPCQPAGRTLYLISGTDYGYIFDDSYYLRRRITLAAGADKPGAAPPDLVVEVVNTHPEAAALDSCTRLGVNEIWVINVRNGEFTIRHRLRSGPNAGALVVRPVSRVFPTLRAVEIRELLALSPGDRTAFDRDVRPWAEQVLLPRVRRRRPGKGT
jgi:hypothetical protein